MPPSRTRPKSLTVPLKEEAEVTRTLAELNLSKTDGGAQVATVSSSLTRRTPLKQILKSDADVKPLRPSIPDLYPQFALEDTKPKVKPDAQDLALFPGKDVGKAKADHARAARAKSRERAARHVAALCADAKVELSLRDMADIDPSRAALRGAVEELKNPDAKVKQELLLSDAFLLDALTWEGINHRHPVTVPLPKPIAEDRDSWHGLDDWAFLSLEWNPTRPGYSGLYFTMDAAATCDERATLGQVKRTFVRRGAESVRRAWARGVLLKGWGEKGLLRIWFRRERGVDFEPKKDDIEDAKQHIEQIRKTMMMCTGYDAEFLRVLQRNAHNFVPPPPKPKKTKAKTSKPKQERDTSTRGTKRKAGTNTSAKDKVEIKPESGEEDARVPGLGGHCQKASVTTARANAKRRKLA
ncbi:hypothetical protein GSI_00088 [Ganoderma sinense ZZ0214-1]|uniref:DUF6697 domain-containing protein n=1 Tax=Ganoderma sinense ZZ0214-1 TaxID=1077348 RepID=A0A2G8SRL3_9APHY|nr:hypothetical protein GSI_00088 [Ganoderma sinense ZZ0214-1]